MIKYTKLYVFLTQLTNSISNLLSANYLFKILEYLYNISAHPCTALMIDLLMILKLSSN